MRILIIVVAVIVPVAIAIAGAVFLFIRLVRSGPHSESKDMQPEQAGGFHDWVRNPERRHDVAEMLAQREEDRRNLSVPADISDAEIEAMVERLFVRED